MRSLWRYDINTNDSYGYNDILFVANITLHAYTCMHCQCVLMYVDL